MKTKKIIFLAAGFSSLLFFAACTENNDTSPDQAKLEIRLTDAPNSNIREVWVDIREVQINSGDSTNWTAVSGAHPGLYNLLALTDGRDTLLADASIPAGRLSQLRLILGDNNYIITHDGNKEMLTTPSAQQSGLKVQVQSDLTGGVLYRLVLDFDAAKSVVEAGNSGKYILKPVIRVLSMVPSGGIAKGFVAPDSVMSTIYAIRGSDTVASTATHDGNYQFRDIPAGNYEFHYYPGPDSFQTAVKTVPVELGKITTVDTVFLQLK